MSRSYGTWQKSGVRAFQLEKLRLKKWEFYLAGEIEENYKIIELITKRHYYEKA
jgi:hypothetical protein